MKKLIYILYAFTAFSLQAMEPSRGAPAAPFQSPTKTTPYFTNSENDGGLKIALQSLEKTAPGDVIAVDAFIVTDSRLTTLLIKKHNEGVKISVNACGSARWSKGQIERLKAAGIDVFVFNESRDMLNPHSNFPVKLHKKSIAWSYTNPTTGQKEYRVWSGGRNLTYMATAHEDKEANEETMVYHRDDKEIYSSQLQAHERTRKRKPGDNTSVRHVVKTTPKKSRTFQSDQHDICASVAERIHNTDSDDSLIMSIFAISHPEIIRACLESAKKGVLKLLITDPYTLKNKESREFLQTLAQQHRVDVRIFNPTGEKKCGRFSIINHEKMFVRKKADGSTLTGIGSTNFTPSNNADITDWTFHPEDQHFAQLCIEHMQELAKKSVSFQEYKSPATRTLFT